MPPALPWAMSPFKILSTIRPRETKPIDRRVVSFLRGQHGNLARHAISSERFHHEILGLLLEFLDGRHDMIVLGRPVMQLENIGGELDSVGTEHLLVCNGKGELLFPGRLAQKEGRR